MEKEDRLILNFIGEEHHSLQELRKVFVKKNDFEGIVDFKRWAWIMPVVEEINIRDDYRFSVTILSMDVQIFDNVNNKLIFESDAKWQPDELLQSIYEAVVEFIKWYNKQK